MFSVCHVLLYCMHTVREFKLSNYIFRPRNDGDLEVGPWREEILTNLQSLKVGTEKFNYPNAVEPKSSSWSKSVKARMIQKSKKGGGINGELEISNNDTLVFHKVFTSCCKENIVSSSKAIYYAL